MQQPCWPPGRKSQKIQPCLLGMGWLPASSCAGSAGKKPIALKTLERLASPAPARVSPPRPGSPWQGGAEPTWMCGWRGQVVPQTRAQRSSFLCAKNSGLRSTATRRPWKRSASAALPSSLPLSSADTGSTIGMLRFTTPSAGRQRAGEHPPAAARPARTAILTSPEQRFPWKFRHCSSLLCAASKWWC